MDKRQKADVQEKQVAKATGGKRRRGSGSYPGTPHDVICTSLDSPLLCECKYTENQKSIRILRDDLRKVESNAILSHRIPALVFGFWEMDGAIDNWLAIPLWMIEKKLVEIKFT